MRFKFEALELLNCNNDTLPFFLQDQDSHLSSPTKHPSEGRPEPQYQADVQFQMADILTTEASALDPKQGSVKWKKRFTLESNLLCGILEVQVYELERELIEPQEGRSFHLRPSFVIERIPEEERKEEMSEYEGGEKSDGPKTPE